MYMNGYRFYLDKDLEYLINEEKEYHHPHYVRRYAMIRLRMYACLYTRNLRKDGYLNKDSVCVFCSVKSDLQIDHIIPISKGGLNKIDNIKILCRKCKTKKTNKIL